MKTTLHVIAYILFIQFIIIKNTGLQIGVKSDLFDEMKEKFLPSLISKYQNFTISDQALDLSLLVTRLYLNITDINFKILNFSADNLHINFIEPESIKATLTNVECEGNFNLKFSMLKILNEEDKISFTFNVRKVETIQSLTQIESKINQGKYLPSLEITSVDLDFDIDFDIQGKFFAKLAKLFKDQIKSLIKSRLVIELKTLIPQKSNIILREFIENQSVYFALNNKGLSVDYSLTTSPKIINELIVLNLNGSFVDHNNKNYFSYEHVPQHQFKAEGKNIQIGISDYLLNSAISTLQSMNMLEVEITTDELPTYSHIKVDTSFMDLYFENFSNNFGKDKNIKLNFSSVDESPHTLEILENLIKLKKDIVCSIFVKMADGIFEEALKFSSTFTLNGNISLKEGEIIHARLDDIDINDSKIIESRIIGSDVEYLEQFVNFLSPILVPFLNNNYLNEYHINIPDIDGISFKDSALNLHDSMIDLQINPEITEDFIKNIIEKILHKFNSGKSTQSSEKKLRFLNSRQ
jgi:hypothetical protein